MSGLPIDPSRLAMHRARKRTNRIALTLSLMAMAFGLFWLAWILFETIWLGIGFLGQGLFFVRLFVQWIASERTAESRVPVSFWYMSLIGGLITLTYAIYRKDPVFISGQALGAVVYVRNLVLIHRADQTKSEPRPQA